MINGGKRQRSRLAQKSAHGGNSEIISSAKSSKTAGAA